MSAAREPTVGQIESLNFIGWTLFALAIGKGWALALPSVFTVLVLFRAASTWHIPLSKSPARGNSFNLALIAAYVVFAGAASVRGEGFEAAAFSVFAIVDLILYLGGLPRPPRPRRRCTFAGAAS